MTSTTPANIFTPPLPDAAGRVNARRWGQLYGSADALAAANACRRYAHTALVIANDAEQAEQLATAMGFFAPDLNVALFPDVDTLPYDRFSPHQDLTGQRLRALAALGAGTLDAVVTEPRALMRRLPPLQFVKARSLDLRPGQTLAPGRLREQLLAAGYVHVSTVVAPGEFAVRGSLIDLYPAGLASPVRVDYFDDDVESLREFDVKTQRSGDALDALTLLPAREFALDEEGIKGFRQRFRKRFEGDPMKCGVYREVSDGNAAAGVENYLPLFFDETATLFDYVGDAPLIIEHLNVRGAAADAFGAAGERFDQFDHDLTAPILTPEELFIEPGALESLIDDERLVRVGRFESTRKDDQAFAFATAAPPNLNLKSQSRSPTEKLAEFVAGYDGALLLVAESPGRRETLLDMLRDQSLRPVAVADWPSFVTKTPPLAVTVAPLQDGLMLPSAGLAVIAEDQLFARRAKSKRRSRSARDPQTVIRDLTDLRIGAPVVHETYGVGRYEGLSHLDAGGANAEYLTLTYADGDKLYVPVHALHLISRYTGASPEHAPLHRLGSDQWDKARRKAARKIRDVAAELLALYAQRAARVGQSLSVSPADYQAFADAFPFEPTIDQAEAIDAIVADMTSLKPMDRLVCGDVGFGKTEVALRAAFVAVQSGRQVVMLVPTTLLAQQHGQTFKDRFADWPVTVEVLSRFRSRKESTEVLKRVASGHVDIVVGTHRLLQPDITFDNLGLVIIDEEHRFGVRHKEKLKALRAEVDVLTLTATPIPRTLNLAMGGLRDLSLITTPPAERLAIKTFVSTWDDTLIREACLREIQRGGQIFFVHNAVQTIEKTARKIAELVPEASIEIGHGQMRERDLEQVMLDFYHRRFNLLVCTTIVESGIDCPAANTIIIDRADRFGLAQLHQLRGRVGRSNRSAFAYLLAPPTNELTDDAVKRLEAIESLEDLGAGFALASHDLEIRGAGELLGEEQSGQIHEIGFSMYMELLDRAVTSLRAGEEPDLSTLQSDGVEIDLHVPAFFPDDYLPDVHMRLVQYKRIASAPDADALRELKVEMIDRFGLIPDEAQALFELALVRLQAAPLGVSRLEAADERGRIVFGPNARVEPAHLIGLIQHEPSVYKFDGKDTLRFNAPMFEPAARFDFIRRTLWALAGESAPA
ncbi:MAG: transcription-repair coupling factor [Pseudomonadota bacterium]